MTAVNGDSEEGIRRRVHDLGRSIQVAPAPTGTIVSAGRRARRRRDRLMAGAGAVAVTVIAVGAAQLHTGHWIVAGGSGGSAVVSGPTPTRPTPAATVTPDAPGYAPVVGYTLGLAVAIRTDGTGLLLGASCDANLRCRAWTRTTGDDGVSFPGSTERLVGPAGDTRSVTGLSVASNAAAYAYDQPGAASGPLRWSTDDGRTWRTSGLADVTSVDSKGSSVWVTTQSCANQLCRTGLRGGLAGSDPAGFTPLALPEPGAGYLSVTRRTPEQAYAVTGQNIVDNKVAPSHLWATTDGGRSWQGRAQPCPAGQAIADAQVSAAPDGTLWMSCLDGQAGAGSVGKNLWRSMTGGRSWSRSGNPGPGGYGTVITAVNSQEAYLTGGRTQVKHTTDGGSSWQPVTAYEDSFGPATPTASGAWLSVVRTEGAGATSTAVPTGAIWRGSGKSPWTLDKLEASPHTVPPPVR